MYTKIVNGSFSNINHHYQLCFDSHFSGEPGSAGYCLVMAALCNRAGHYIFALWFPSIYPFFLA